MQSMRGAAKYIFWLLAIVFVGGFLFAETSGLVGGAAVTSSTPVATVDGRDIPYTAWVNLSSRLDQQETQRLGRSLTLDERRRVEDQAFDQLVTDVLMEREIKCRGIGLTEQEIVEAARYNPPPELMQSPELQTDGRFDPEKYQRFLNSPAAKQGGMLLQLEGYYRSELPKQKLFEQIASAVYISDTRLWNIWQDTHDTAQVTFVSFRPELVDDSAVTVTDKELRDYYDAHKKDLDRPGRGIVSLVTIPRIVSPADSAAARAKILALRNEIAGGAKFEDVAKRESQDSASAADGGSLGRGPKGRFVKEFEDAAYALAPGALSQPVLSSFGYHLIKVDSRVGDTIAVRHILIRIQQSDSSAARTDRLADSLAGIAAGADQPAKFDEAAKRLGLKVQRLQVVEGEPLTVDGKYVPSVSAWAFGGARAGESSDLFDSEDGYFLARLDSIVTGGVPTFDQARQDIRTILARQKKVQVLMPRAQALAKAAAATSLEQAAQAQGLTAKASAPFARVSPVPGLGQLNEAIGAAFTLPAGAVSDAIATRTGAVVLRVDRRVLADKAAWAKQKELQRTQLLQGLREQKVRDFLAGLRKNAKVTDRRKEIQAVQRRQST